MKILATYFITFISALLILGGVAYYAYNNYILDSSVDTSLDDFSDEEYSPEFSQNKNILIVLDAGNNENDCNFMVWRFVASQGKIILLPLPTNTEVSGESTLYNIYKNKGISDLSDAVSTELSLGIDKYIKFSEESFIDTVDILGGADYNIPNDILYTNPENGEQTLFSSGINYLDFYSMLKVLSYPDYDSGDEYRSKIFAICISEMFNKNKTENFTSNMDDYFNVLVNSDIETDISVYDYDDSADAIDYLYEQSGDIASYLLISGTTDENGRYTLDKEFLSKLDEWLVLTDDSLETVLE